MGFGLLQNASFCHCEERSSAAISSFPQGIATRREASPDASAQPPSPREVPSASEAEGVSLSLVLASSVSFAPAQAPGLIHSAARPLPTRAPLLRGPHWAASSLIVRVPIVARPWPPYHKGAVSRQADWGLQYHPPEAPHSLVIVKLMTVPRGGRRGGENNSELAREDDTSSAPV